MIEVGQEVVLMSAPGRFRIVEVDRQYVVIEDAEGRRRKVTAAAVRVVPPRNPAPAA